MAYLSRSLVQSSFKLYVCRGFHGVWIRCHCTSSVRSTNLSCRRNMATSGTDAVAGVTTQHSVLSSSFPVLLPKDGSLFMAETEFQSFLTKAIARSRNPSLKELEDAITTLDTSDANTIAAPEPKAPFIQGLEKHAAHHQTQHDLAAKNQTLTQNADVTNISSLSAVVDLFYDLDEHISGDELKKLLDNAWEEDPLLTLKLIYNARSIHLGKSNKVAYYKAFGWLAENHPLTLLANLRWLVRPVIEKKVVKKDEAKSEGKDEDEDFDMINVEETDPLKAYDVRHGLSHGYWKDLLNLVVFAANDQLTTKGDPTALLNQTRDNSSEGKRKRNWDKASAKESRHQKKKEQNNHVQEKLKNDAFYQALHVSVARLFAAQLKEDKALLESGKKSDLRKISLAAKWAPSFGEFHDKHTFILSTIAEILFPDAASCPDPTNREQYLRHAREHYRRDYASPLRKALNIVEREIAAVTFENIKYDRVPSLAMDRYTKLFMQKDFERFKSYVKDVVKGDSKISGATLLPSTLVSKAKTVAQNSLIVGKDMKSIKAAAEAQITGDVLNGQWNTLVQRVRDAGTLESSIAVCDVSGSMSSPRFKDGSCPMDAAIGLSLLIAEVTQAPFGGGFISFDATPTYISVGGDAQSDPRDFVNKVRYITNTPWGYNTDFVAVFEKVILPMAIANKLSADDMVKQIFVFSDMQFDMAQQSASDRWTSSYERIKQKYADAGYEMPRLIFWNLAAREKSKPVTVQDMDTALVSGYSQGMLRVLMESGALDEEEELVEEEVEKGEGGEGWVVEKKEKKKLEPITVVKKAVAHKAFDMLEVVD
ncbi:hypothetical protein IQ07DRAFT_585879 [Pyrenochaeta sp. DS3sAY3a]|nr:hypothetical protein IQ07DRAFT_585879 [Pyrenochaeta sp. DS3sAY3a]